MRPFTWAAGGRTVVFVPLAGPDVAVISDALKWHVKGLRRYGYHAPLEAAWVMMERAREWWRLLGEVRGG